MEELRKQHSSAASELIPLKGSQPKRREVKPIQSSSPNTVITISSSSESSPTNASSPAFEKAIASPSVTGSPTNDNDDISDIRLSHRFKPAKPKVKRLIWSDDEDEQPSITSIRPLIQAKIGKPSSINPPANGKASTDAVLNRPKPKDGPLRDMINVTTSDEDERPNLFAKTPKVDQLQFKKPPTIIRPPTIPPPGSMQPGDAPLWETFDEAAVEHLHDPKKTVEEAERDLKDLLSSSMNDVVIDFDMQDAIVDGFQEEIKLLPHQVIGRKWMAERESGKKAGGILADDMGLGKTIQTLTRIVDGRPRKSDKSAGYAASTIVVCPVALVSQWASEVQKIAVGLRVIEHHGPSRTTNPESLKRAHIVITSYSVLASEHSAYYQLARNASTDKSRSKTRRDDTSEESDSSDDFIARTVVKKGTRKPKKVMDALFHVKWWRIVLDEAHNIKNRNTKAAKACFALEGKFRWALTGTPMQNNVEELYSLLNFLRIRPLNDWEKFNQEINKPVKSGKSVRAMKKLQVVLKAIMLRRKKDSMLNGERLLELPDRNVEIVPCTFDADEREFYESLSTKIESTLDKFRQKGDIGKNLTSVLVLLLRLRQACNHPSLVSKDFQFDKEAVDPKATKDGKDLEDADDLADLFGQMGVSSKCQLCQQTFTKETSNGQYCPDCESIASKSRRRSHASRLNELPPDSAKIRALLQILRKIRDSTNGEKTIVFSQFTSMLDLIQPFLRSEGFNFVRYDGSMRKDQREESLRRIREDRSTTIILISFKAGSTGLNLTACNNVILVDLWWNPALEDQAFDRAHRFGQTRNVNIWKLTIEGTVEERILDLQEKKRALTAAALSGDKVKNSRLNLEELMALFKPGGKDEDEENE